MAGSKDPFENLVRILGGIRADWVVKKRLLDEIGALLGEDPDRNLPTKVAECITNPEEIRRLQAESNRLQVEADTLRAEVTVLKDNAAAMREMAEEVRRLAAEVKTGSVSTRARLFDEGVHEEKKLSGGRIIRILTDFSEQIEKLLVDTREAANQIEESSRKLSEAPLRLSDISLPDLYVTPSHEGKDKTPQSSRVAEASGSGQLRPHTIDLDSPSVPMVEIPVPMENRTGTGTISWRKRNLQLRVPQ